MDILERCPVQVIPSALQNSRNRNGPTRQSLKISYLTIPWSLLKLDTNEVAAYDAALPSRNLWSRCEEACAHHVPTGNARNAAHTSDTEDSSHSLTNSFPIDNARHGQPGRLHYCPATNETLTRHGTACAHRASTGNTHHGPRDCQCRLDFEVEQESGNHVMNGEERDELSGSRRKTHTHAHSIE